jgi:hypothetical protein
MPTLECYRRRRPQARPGQRRTPGPAQGGLPAIIIIATPMMDNLPTLSALPEHLQLPRQVSATHVGQLALSKGVPSSATPGGIAAACAGGLQEPYSSVR